MSTPRTRRFGATTPLGLALLVVLLLLGSTGGAVAGALITGKQIKDGTVSTIDVTNESLTGTDVRNETLTGADVRNATVTGLDIRDGSVTAADLIDEARMWGAIENEPVGVATEEDGGSTLVSKTFTTPAGYLQLTGGLDANDDDEVVDAGALVATLYIDGQQIDNARFLEFQSEGGGDTASLTAVVPVTAGPHTIELVGFEIGTGSVVWSRDLSAVYTPTGSASTPTVAGRQLPPRVAQR
ncbi:hypothetical protein [Nocardioides sp. WS12]|uniref:hypothetical protein n=1 Tax=Nocardioides sp. WS12 TaxID=2486272 RepID=UPI0015FD6C2E|nr:hypothetical protein [Nocardioides sp. WS12]